MKRSMPPQRHRFGEFFNSTNVYLKKSRTPVIGAMSSASITKDEKEEVFSLKLCWICNLCGTEAVVITFAGNTFDFKNPFVDSRSNIELLTKEQDRFLQIAKISKNTNVTMQ
ncbi:hypothetical protein HYC85_023986 [Camellia sinensis]|uniref:MADS-box domain-containing protein n=1 Tax=Camellia sinensis TaxID=4442 RepID=A0A7J7GGW0_CAMSI|nr:hypothetical protein HYC85_023986 [Camellia sinensis]